MREWALDEQGRLASLVQQGWRVEYAYRRDSREGSSEELPGLALPARITLRGEGVVVRVAIRGWRID